MVNDARGRSRECFAQSSERTQTTLMMVKGTSLLVHMDKRKTTTTKASIRNIVLIIEVNLEFLS